MGAPLLPNIRWRALDANGAPLSGAKLYAFAAGTSTPKNTFSDSALSSANANPVVANSGGLFGAIYGEPGAYKFRLDDADGNVIWTQDNVSLSAVNPTLVSVTSTYNVTEADGGDALVAVSASGGAVTVGLYTAVGTAGNQITVKKEDTSTNAVTVDPNGSETMDAVTTFKLYRRGDFVQLRSDGAKWVIVGARTTIKARAYLTAAQTAVTTGTPTKVAFSAEDYDTAGAFDSTTNRRFTVPSWLPGDSEFRVDAGIEVDDANSALVSASIRVDGVEQKVTELDAGTTVMAQVSFQGDLDPTQYFELYGTHNKGSNGQFNAGSARTFIEVTYTGIYS